MTDKEAQLIVQEAADRLGEHFECVIVLASDSESDMTTMGQAWSGNYYAAKGMAQEFLDNPPTDADE
jgi:hypothetical protein